MVQSTSIYYRTSREVKASDGFNRIMEIEPTNCMKECRSFAEVTTWLKNRRIHAQSKTKQILKDFLQ
jgi:hypothetical protein